ncbi:MAG: trypsin-like peptidase domain-containing protein [Psychrobium sp.]
MFKGLVSTFKAVAVGIAIGAVIVIALPNTRTATLSAVKEWLVTHTAPLSYSYAIKRSAPAVVNIYSITQHRDTFNNSKADIQGLGSGVIMSSNGIIITNLHVISGADIIYVALQDGRHAIASIVGTDDYTDLAVLHIKEDNLPVIPFDLKKEPQIGDLVLAIGNPYNLGQTITQGIVSATGRNRGITRSAFQHLLQTDAAINDGNSGGALINSRGELVGINAANFQSLDTNSSNGIGFAIPVKIAYKVLKDIIAEGYVPRGSLGFNIGGVFRQDNRTTYGEVSAIEPNGPADIGGMKVGDIIVAVNNTPFASIDDLLHVISETKPNNEIELTVLRGTESFNLSMKTVQRPPLTLNAR